MVERGGRGINPSPKGCSQMRSGIEIADEEKPGSASSSMDESAGISKRRFKRVDKR
jgi:hypothetical protein